MSKREKLIKKLRFIEKYKASLKARKGLSDLYYFNKHILEEGNPERQKNIVPHVHKEWWDWYKSSDRRLNLILVPRHTLKSTFFTVGMTLQRIAKDRDVRILIANATRDNAVLFLSEIKQHIRENENYIKNYGEMYDESLTWKEDEIVVAGRSPSTRNPTVSAAGVGGNLVSRHYDLIIADDLVNEKNVNTRKLANDVKDWWRRAMSLLSPQGEMLTIGCLIGDTKILMGDNSWKNMSEISVGEEVLTYSESGLEARVVKNVIPQGEDEIFEVSTGHQKVRGNARHPFLKLVPKSGVKLARSLDGWQRIDDFSLEWVPLKDLCEGDLVVSIFESDGSDCDITDDFAWLLGYMVGDGWIVNRDDNSRGNVTCVAMGEDKKLNEKIVAVFEKETGTTLGDISSGYRRTDAAVASDLFSKYGLDLGAKNKRIPTDVFGWPIRKRKLFLRGLIDADGWKEGRYRYSIELASENLVKDIQLLCYMSGCGTTNIYHRSRYCQPPNSPEPVLSNTWHVGIRFDGLNLDGRFRGEVVDAGKLPDEFKFERIKSIESAGTEEVFDLSIEKNENFIAEGFIVHNTRWSHYDLYQYILDELPHRVDSYVRAAKKDGELYYPEMLDQQTLDELKEMQGSYIYSAFYRNDPVDPKSALLRRHNIHYYDIECPCGEVHRKPQRGEMAVFIMSDPAVSQRTQADYSSIITAGVDQENNWWVLEARHDRWTVDELLYRLFDTHKRYDADGVSIEVIGLGQSLLSTIHDHENVTNQFLPLTEIKSRGGKKKEARIRSVLQPRFERGKVFIDSRMTELENELLRYPRSKHDDMIDALSDLGEIGFPPTFVDENKNREPSTIQERVWASLNRRDEHVDPVLGSRF